MGQSPLGHADMETINSVVNYISEFRFEPGVTPLTSYQTPLAIGAGYLAFVYLLKAVMKNRERIPAKTFSLIHNFNMYAISIVCFTGITYGVLQTLYVRAHKSPSNCLAFRHGAPVSGLARAAHMALLRAPLPSRSAPVASSSYDKVPTTFCDTFGTAPLHRTPERRPRNELPCARAALRRGFALRHRSSGLQLDHLAFRPLDSDARRSQAHLGNQTSASTTRTRAVGPTRASSRHHPHGSKKKKKQTAHRMLHLSLPRSPRHS